ncbi:MAG TPA: hypothetical protein VFU41_01890 [Gemmatimonadales bacterium]|nr:hypothetical protein [Gemmatimonadales bacterium]
MLLALGLAALEGTAAQQRFSGSAWASLAEHRVDAGFGLERASGLVFGAAVSAHVGPRLELALRAQGGSLEASTAGAVDRDLGEIALATRVAAASFLSLQAEASRRVYSSAIARQAWTLVGVGAEVQVPFIEKAVRGLARAGFLPVVSVEGLHRPDLAFTAAAGLEYAAGAITLRALYSLERYDFPAQDAGRRPEQLSALTLQLSLAPARRR